MHFAGIVASFLAVVAVAASPSPNRRSVITANTIVADIIAIDNGVNNLRTAIAGYNGGLLSATPLVPGFTEIEVANRKGYADANLAPTFDAAGSTKIVKTVQDTVAIDIPASVKELKAKKPLFQASGQDPVVVSTLKVLLYDHDTFSAAVSQKLTADLAAGAAAVALIHNAIQDGIDYFST